MGNYKTRVEVPATSLLQGSVDIDAATTALYPQANRWDYAFAYNSEVYFIEVHSAHTSEVRTVIRKFEWLKSWLHHHAPEINKLKATKTHPFYWIQSKNFQIPKNSPQYLVATQANLKPISRLVLK